MEQRAAFPLASSFVVWATALLGSTFAWRRFRRWDARFWQACLWGAAALALAALVVTSLPTVRAWAGNPPHGIYGVAKGICPGRVVWVHAPDATSWAGYTSAEHWFETNHTDLAVVEEMMSRAVRAVGGGWGRWIGLGAAALAIAFGVAWLVDAEAEALDRDDRMHLVYSGLLAVVLLSGLAVHLRHRPKAALGQAAAWIGVGLALVLGYSFCFEAVFNLILDFTLMLGSGTWSDVSLSFIINAIILIYVMPPGVKKAFETS